jgi:hypothetical protein
MDLLVTHHRATGELRLDPDRIRHRLLARLLSSSLDQRLADGRPPESSLLSASRAGQLVAPSFRAAVARDVARLRQWAPRPSAARGRRLSPDGKAIARVQPELRRIEAVLAAPYPAGARGVAMLNVLLTDGTGPFYNRGCPVDLATALRRALEQLDPGASLVPQP